MTRTKVRWPVLRQPDCHPLGVVGRGRRVV